MIGLDTNVLVRYLTQDDAAQSAMANKIIEDAIKSDTPLVINTLVLCELSWVIIRAYKIPKNELIDLLEKIILTAQFEIEDREIVWQALADYKAHKADFSDALISRKNVGIGCKVTYSFDVQCALLPTFSLIKKV